MPRERYDSSDETLHKPVSVEELDALLEVRGKPILDRYRIQHFLYRARLTLHAAETSITDLRRSVEAASEKKRRHGAPTTLTPMDAVRFASPEELAVIVGNISSSQIKALAAQVDAARATRDELAATLEQVRSAALTLAHRTDLPAAVRAEFTDLLATLPPTPPEIETPKAIELGRMAGLLDDETQPAPLPSGASGAGAPLALSAPAAAGPHAAAPAAGPGSALVPAGVTPAPAAAPHVHQGEDRQVHAVIDLPCYGPVPSWQPGPGLVRTDKEQP